MQLTRTQAFLIDHQPVVKLVVMFSLYVKESGSAFRYLLSPKRVKAGGYLYKSFIIHILVSHMIVSRYYVLQLFSVPIPGRLDLALGLVQAASSFYTAKHTMRNDTMFRGRFQVMSAMNLVSIITAFVTGQSAMASCPGQVYRLSHVLPLGT